MSITTLNNLSLNNEYYLEVISRLKNGRQTRNTNKKIKEYDNLIRKNLYDQVRIITEMYYYTYEYDNLFNDFKVLNKFKKSLVKNPHICNPITDEEKYIIHAFYHQLDIINKPKVEPKTITELCIKYDPKLLEMAKKDIHIFNDFVPSNIREICYYIHIDLKPNYNEINVLLIIANYLLHNSYLNLYKDFIFNCPEKFLMTYMNNSETSPQILVKLIKLNMTDLLDLLIQYIHDTKINTWYQRYN